MKMIKPQNDMVLCICTTDSKKKLDSGFEYKSNDIKLYKIVGVGPKISADNFAIGDTVVVNSSGTLVKTDDAEYYLFKEENIAGKVCEYA